ncbi:hypothetical protein GCM10007901_11800 [Dyella acidisoli]|uniref:Uncharacterized protein n=1 Tax=Dyella acidisoli TaxID=1867834 RepID=A0ABQ5XM01_9GAMM|nr:hypothetical protein GCM10007901_11800 [Dyella acidisoli]
MAQRQTGRLVKPRAAAWRPLGHNEGYAEIVDRLLGYDGKSDLQEMADVDHRVRIA